MAERSRPAAAAAAAKVAARSIDWCRRRRAPYCLANGPPLACGRNSGTQAPRSYRVFCRPIWPLATWAGLKSGWRRADFASSAASAAAGPIQSQAASNEPTNERPAAAKSGPRLEHRLADPS